MGRSFCVITKICCSCYTTSKYNVEKGLSIAGNPLFVLSEIFVMGDAGNV